MTIKERQEKIYLVAWQVRSNCQLNQRCPFTIGGANRSWKVDIKVDLISSNDEVCGRRSVY